MRSHHPAGISAPLRPRRFRTSIGFRATAACLLAAVWLIPGTSSVRGDEVELQDGERLTGKVLVLTTNALVFQSEGLGKVNLPRERVVVITLGRRASNPAAGLPAATNQLARALRAPPATNALSAAAALGHFDAGTKSIGQVQSQLLRDAGPEANRLFSQMAAGVLSGKISVNDLRAQAQAVADQARALKREGGEDPSGMIDAYLSILDDFLRDSAPSAQTPSPAPAR